MMLNDICDRLISSAREIGWIAVEEPTFAAKKFRGREANAEVPLPQRTIGMRLGAYPVLLVNVELGAEEAISAQLKKVHNQMFLARSYMRAGELINAHIILVADDTADHIDPEQLRDVIERDETVCRKLVWDIRENSEEQSYQEFIERTFLAQPWAFTHNEVNAPLDQNDELVERVLQKQGLSSAAASKWVELIDAKLDDPEYFVERLVAAMDDKQ